MLRSDKRTCADNTTMSSSSDEIGETVQASCSDMEAVIAPINDVSAMGQIDVGVLVHAARALLKPGGRYCT